MQFNDTTNHSGIIQMIEKSLGYGYGDITENPVRLAYVTNLCNMWLGTVANIIWKNSTNWYFDDKNETTTLPIVTTTLVEGQSDYLLPSNLLGINKVEVMDSNGNYYEVKFIKQNDSRLKNKQFQETASMPLYYYAIGRSLILYPRPTASQVTLVDGLRITLNREANYFVVTDTTKEPGFSPANLHWILVYGTIFHQSGMRDNNNAKETAKEMLYGQNGLIEQLEEYYSNDRDKDDSVIITSAFAKENFE